MDFSIKLLQDISPSLFILTVFWFVSEFSSPISFCPTVNAASCCCFAVEGVDDSEDVVVENIIRQGLGFRIAATALPEKEREIKLTGSTQVQRGEVAAVVVVAK
jgi:hypothetical protein